MRAVRFIAAAGAAVALLSCGDSSDDSPMDEPEPGFQFEAVNVDPAAGAAALISEYQLVHAEDDGALTYNSGVQRYTLNTPLFSDYALKDRAIYVPPGQPVQYDDDEVFEFPVGTAIIKTFSFPADLRSPEQDVRVIETRVLILTAEGWESYPYVWSEDGSDAEYAPAGKVESITFVDNDGETQTADYLVPQRNQCRSCHEISDGSGGSVVTLIGPKARHLNGPLDGDPSNGNQLDAWESAGLLQGLPATDRPEVEPFTDADSDSIEDATFEELDALARGYLDINCGHCHNPAAVEGVASQLWLDVGNDDPFNLGVCKRPGSAGRGAGGREFDIVPGNADESILVFRVETEEIGAMMPQIGRSLAHREGAALLRAWVNAMDPQICE